MDLRRRFANLPKESDVREPYGRSCYGRKPFAGFGSGDAKQRRSGDRPDDDEGTGETSSGALGKDPSEIAGGNLRSEPLTTSADAYLYLSGDKVAVSSSPQGQRVEIPKPSGGTRMLGIPTVQDRFIQQMMLQVLTPIFDPMFSESSYGFRPGRSAQDAVQAAQKYAQEGKDWVVDIDITKFFDHVNHDILMGRIGKVIRDKRVLHLIGKLLRRGAMVDGLVEASVEGTPQGGPLSPLLANIYLDALDKELERRGHAYCRYADDSNIYVSSQAAAERTLESIQNWIEKHLRLKVNTAKSGTGRTEERKFLGFRLDREGRIEVAPESIERFKAKVREKWRANQSRTSRELRDDWVRYVRGWWGYYQLAAVRKPIYQLEGWIRRHIRKRF